jgi:PRTRC genetic system protein A
MNLMDLFDVEDYEKGKKGKKSGTGKGAKGGKKETAAKGVRYPLPVRVSAGHIRCLLDAGEFSGKTVSETDVKKKIREVYPELAGVEFSLVKFSNSYTEQYENNNSIIPNEIEGETTKEKPETEKLVEAPLDFAAAEDEAEEGLPEKVEENAEAAEESFEDGEDADMTETEAEDTADAGKNRDNTPAKGCWIKLDISYKSAAEEENIFIPVTVKAGNTFMEFTEEAADSLAEIRERWTALHPEYENCKFHYDDKQNLLIPFVRGEAEIKGKKYSLPVKVGYLDDMVTYTAQDFGDDTLQSVTQEQIRKLYAVNHPEFDNAIFSYVEKINSLFPVINFKKTDEAAKYSLPLKLRGSGFVLDLETVDFEGKTEVTLEEVRVALEEVYPEFSKERTEMIYDERGFIIPVLKGSKKGLTVTSTRKNQNLFMVQGRDGNRYRIEQMPYGQFDCREDGAEADFHLSAGKIPGSLFSEILRFFRKDPRREAAAQIFYDDKAGTYELHFPEQKADVCTVIFDRDMLLESEKVLVMDVHSHGQMNAFFSSVDDHDEKGTRLFLVLGKIGGRMPAWKLRAGIAGHYRELAFSDVFDMEGVLYD